MSLLALLAAALAAPALSQPVDNAPAQQAARALVRQAQDLPDDEPGEVTDEEASREPVEVSAGVFRSARPSEAVLETLLERGFKTILNLENGGAPAAERKALALIEARRAAQGKPAWHVDDRSVAMSGIRPPTFAQLDRALAALSDPARRPMLVHCKHGEDRTGVVIAAYRLEVEKKLTLDQAIAEAKSFHCCHLVLIGEAALREYLELYHRHRAGL